MSLDEEIREISEEVETELSPLSPEEKDKVLKAHQTLDRWWDKYITNNPDGTATITAQTLEEALKGAEMIGRKLIPETTFYVTPLGHDLNPPTDDDTLRKALREAHDDLALSTEPGLRGPEEVEGIFIYGLPLIPAGGNLPTGTLIVTAPHELDKNEKRMIVLYSQQLDTRLAYLPPLIIPEKRREEPAKKKETTSSKVAIFGISINREEYQEWRSQYQKLTKGVAESLKREGYFIPLKHGVVDPHDSPGLESILEQLAYLPAVARALPEEPRADSFRDLIRSIYDENKKGESTYGDLPKFMNDTPEAEELHLSEARENPAAFHAANIGEALALIALYKTLFNKRETFSKSEEAKKIDSLIQQYGSARAYLRATTEIPLQDEKPRNFLLKDLPGMSHYLSIIR